MTSQKAEALSATHRDLLARIRLLTEQAEAQRQQEEVEEATRRQAEEAALREQAEQGLQADAPALSGSAKDEAVGRVRALMDELDVTVVDILASIGRLEPEASGRRSRQQGKPRTRYAGDDSASARRRPATVSYQDDPNAPVRYRHPETGETWSGTGRVPPWIHENEKRGVSRDQFLVA